MRRATAAALVLVATALMVPAPANAGAAPPPGELWSEFPLEPRTATTPAGSAPAPVQVVERPAQPQGEASGADGQAVWIFILIGAVAAGSVGLVARHRRSPGRQQPGRTSERKPAQAVRTVDRPVSGAAASDTAAVADVDRPRVVVAERLSPTLIQTLSPQARLADQLEVRKSDVEPETHQVCEIACWRGYVTWQFYVKSESPLDPSLFSPYFRARGKRAPEQSDNALQAHAVLVEKLVASGWEPEGYGEDWFSERFQRTAPPSA